MKPLSLLLIFVAVGCFLWFLPPVRAADWQVMWKDGAQELRLDRESVRVDGSQVEYWYSDEVDAVVDVMTHHYHAVSDCAAHRIMLLEVYDPLTGQTRPIEEQSWRDLPYDPADSLSVMQDSLCRDYYHSTAV